MVRSRLVRRVWLPLSICAAVAVLYAQVGSGPGPRAVEPFTPSSPSYETGSEEQRLARIKELEAQGIMGTISGKVMLFDGRPAVGWRVVVTTGSPGDRWMPGTRQDAVTRSDGSFELRGLGKYKFTVFVDTSGEPYLEPPHSTIDLRSVPSATGVAFTLKPGPMVTVRVIDAETKKPVPGLKVAIGNPFGLPAANHTTDQNGEFVGRVGLLQFKVELEDPDKARAYGPAPGHNFYHEVSLPSPSPTLLEVMAYRESYQPRTAKFTGLVVDKAGNPVAGATVRLQRYNDLLNASTDKDGRFEFSTFRVSTHEDPKRGAALMAEKNGERAFKVLTAEETWGPVKIVLGTEGRMAIVGRVLDQRGRPAAGCQITYWESFGTSIGSVQPSNGGVTDAEGRFRLTDLHPGAFYSFAFGGSSAGRHMGVTKVPGTGMIELDENKDLGNVTVPTAEQSVSGIVTDLLGKPLTGSILVIATGDHTSQSASPDANGRFKLNGIVDEPLNLRVVVGEDGTYRTGSDSPDILHSQPIRAGESVRLKVKPRRAQ